MIRHGIAVLAVSAAFSSPAQAQVRASEKGTVTQVIAGTTLTIDYSRPSLRGRDSMMGPLIPWGELWTPGANNVTTLATSRAIRLGGQLVAAGKYGLWIEARRDSVWLLHLARDTTRWHLPHPPRSDAILSIPLRVERTPSGRETLTWTFDRIRAGGALLQLLWGSVIASVDIALDTPRRTTIDAATAARYEGQWTEFRVSDTARARPRSSRLYFDRGTSQLLATLPPGEVPHGEGMNWSLIYLPRAEDVFTRGYTMNGELAFAGAETEQSYVEFTLQNGRAVSYVVRNPRDSIVARGERGGGEK
jgi:hypothetical protein